MFKQCTKKFCTVQNLVSEEFQLLRVIITLKAKLTQYIRPVKQHFILVSEKKKKNDSIIFFSFMLKAKDKPLTELLQLKQSLSKWIFFPFYFTFTRNIYEVLSVLKFLKNMARP